MALRGRLEPLPALAAIPARERDVRMEGAPLGLRARPRCSARSTLAARATTGSRGSTPAHSAPPLRRSNRPTPGCGAEAGRMQTRQSASGDIVGHRTLDLTDEAQRQVQAARRRPSAARAVVHRVDQQVADRLRRANGDEQPVHRFLYASSASAFRVRFRLNGPPASTIYSA